jgi:hypothetical protein
MAAVDMLEHCYPEDKEVFTMFFKTLQEFSVEKMEIFSKELTEILNENRNRNAQLKFQWFPMTRQKIKEDKNRFKGGFDEIDYVDAVINGPWVYEDKRHGCFLKQKNGISHGFMRTYCCDFRDDYEFQISNFRLKGKTYGEALGYGEVFRFSFDFS